MPKHQKKQRRLDFQENEPTDDGRIAAGKRAAGRIDYSFSKRLSKKGSLKESKIYEGILALIKHRYPS